MSHVLIVGGYGAFGALLAQRLAREPGWTITVAGRDVVRAQACAESLRRDARAELRAVRADATSITAQDIAALDAKIVINASGPFQAHDYTLARACIAAGVHYIDLADARDFVTGIATLDEAAKEAGVCVVSGASSVPGLSSAVFLALKPRFSAVWSLEIFLSPGNHFNPGVATTRSVLGGVGQPIVMRENGRRRVVYGWQGLRRRRIAGIGPRWFGYVDVPDLELFPAAETSLRTVSFRAGVEVPLFHFSLWALGGLVRLGVVRSAAKFTQPLLDLKQRLSWLGSDRGGMLVTLSGTGPDGRLLTLDWSLAAVAGHGPYIPTVAATILAKRIARGEGPAAGARACFGLFIRDEFLSEVSDLRITSDTIVR